MLNKLLVLSIFSIISFPVFSETYVCSHELTRYNRPGEIETMWYKREGNSFLYDFDNSDEPMFYQIFFESESRLILTWGGVGDKNTGLDVVFIYKDTKEFGRKYVSMIDIRDDIRNPYTYGKCVVVN